MDRGAQKRKQSALKIDLKSTNGLYMTTVNPCNDFLVDFLIASKLKSEKQGIGKFTTYNLAIESVRKYPLPIICEAQLAALEGFGDFFINQSAKRIQKHYKRGRLPTQQQILQDDQEHFEALQNNRRKGYRRKKQATNDDEGEQQSQEQSEDLGNQQEDRNQQKQQQKKEKNSQSKNYYSQGEQNKSKKNQVFKPKKYTEPWRVLAALYALDARNKTVWKGQINQIFLNCGQKEIKYSWQFCRSRLEEHGYIQMDKVEVDLLKLTQKGYCFILEELGPDAHKYKQKMENKMQEDSNKVFRVDNKGKLRLVEYESSEPLKIIVSQSLEVSQQLKYLIPDVLGQNKIQITEMKFGSFAWKVYGKLLEYLVIRFQFLSDKFNRQNLALVCNLARTCEWAHITVIVEGMVTDRNGSYEKNNDYDFDQILTQKMENMRKALFDCRAAGFKIVCVKDLQATLEYVLGITSVIKQKLGDLKFNGGLIIAGTLESINKKATQSKMMAKLYSKCIRLLPGINRAAAEALTLKFGTFKLTQQKMRVKFKQMKLRKKFLMKLLENYEVGEENVEKILRFLYSNSYS